MWTSLTSGGSGVRTATFLHNKRASLTVIPTFIPNRFASIEGDTTQPLGVAYAATTTGFPRRCIFACCSTVAKQELRSTCMIVGLFWLIGSSIGYFLQCPVKSFAIQPQSKVQIVIGDMKNVLNVSSQSDAVIIGQFFDEEFSSLPVKLKGGNDAFHPVIFADDAYFFI